MKNKIIAGFFLLGTLLLVSSFVSANHEWWHFWGDEPGFGPFNATITVQGSAPRIEKIINISDDYASTLPGSNVTAVTPGGLSNVYVVFIAEDDNGDGDLPTGAIGIGVGADQINISLYERGVLAIPTPNTITGGQAAAGVTCNSIPGCDGGSPLPQCDLPNNQKMYHCTLGAPSAGMQYYYEGIPGGVSPHWAVNVSIRDGSGLFGINDTKNFTYLQTSDIILGNASIVWNSISLSGTNQKASQNLTFINNANEIESSLAVTPFNFTGRSFPGVNSYIPGNITRASGTLGSECAAGFIFTENLASAISLPNPLEYGIKSSVTTPRGNASVYFCLYHALNILPGGLQFQDTTYYANGSSYSITGTKDWEVTFTDDP